MNAPVQPRPWGRASGLLAGCATTGVGICIGLDPDVIVWRSFVSAIVIGISVTTLTRVLKGCLDEE